jgi:hypothetical protein
MDVPTAAINSLPEGAGYTARDGQAHLDIRRKGDNLIITARCDSIARQCEYYEEVVFRVSRQVERLREENRHLQNALSRAETTAQELHKSLEKGQRGIPWYGWLGLGFVLGFISDIAPKKGLLSLISKIRQYVTSLRK